ncbi:MAG: HlyD family secretion protein [Leptolyngbyaceae cyanobacterium MAG.088]|nr:HlyD family secretion protein [Leptolyngbyaceae cyanobacterium MAG.088]
MVDSLSKASQPKILSKPKSNITFSDEKFSIWWRSLVGLAYVSTGVVATVIGLASISYRLTHLTVKGGLVNGRSVRIQAPVDGKIRDFYARPGARVRTGQVLAQLTPIALQPQSNSPLVADNIAEGQLSTQSLQIRLDSAQQTLELFNQQLQKLNQQEQILQNATLDVASETIDYSDAAVTAAISEEKAARNKYERFNVLLEKGAISQQEVDELEADWRSSQAAVEQAQAERAIALINADAIAQQVPMESNLKGLQSQKQQLAEEIQRQATQIELLSLELASRAPETIEAVNVSSVVKTTSSTTSDASLIPLVAPFEGVIYATHHDTGEQVNRPAALLSLLDCNALWVEALVTADQARRIDARQPVRIQHSGGAETVVGHVDFVTAISAGEITKARAEALIPAVSANLAGQPLARVRVSMPSTQIQENDYQFCGVGEAAKLTFGTQGNPITEFFSRLPHF